MSAVLRLVRAENDGVAKPPAVDLLDAWRAHMTAYGCSPNTVDVRGRIMSGLMAHAGVTDPLDLTRDHVTAWLGRPIKPWSRKTYWKTVQLFSRWLQELGHDPTSDLTRGIPQPKTPDPVARPIDDATIERLLALRLSVRAHAYVRLALYQALRVHEIAKIRGRTSTSLRAG